MSEEQPLRPSAASDVIEIDMLRAATDRIFEHRKRLRTTEVRLGFWPDGLRIGVGSSIEVIPWERLRNITQAELVAAVDRVAGYIEWLKEPPR
ncbi:hypothetical protein MIC97_21695 [Aquamicrobium sp. NLF2-7]|uniref:hypothetical protein n=1 Tax=Aquamicrobium sp. NLF2-7 TaxID=2918753 RepID=UPI001EFA6E0F|nr:hypothetical protein [Aquamicrobium sp. NLF2-7]MCG8274102.1 hypothetical protein [Aquamicrobium sp. NLF2-7]